MSDDHRSSDGSSACYCQRHSAVHYLKVCMAHAASRHPDEDLIITDGGYLEIFYLKRLTYLIEDCSFHPSAP